MDEQKTEDIFAELAERFADEVEVAEKYWSIADQARAEGHRYLSRNLREISAQEMHHAHYLRDYLTKHGHFDEEKHKEAEEIYLRMIHRLG